MILGLGIDVCSIERMRGILDKWGDRFWNRILCEEEREQLAKRADRATVLAGRYAAKEAAAKALSGGRGVGWHHVQVLSSRRRPPEMRLVGPARASADRVGVTHVHLSITHDAGVAAAVVVMEGEPTGEPWP
ncbi:MAG: holo-ACP synthase [Deltaproteobacteria bacterium]|nr:holo-ACP synthase [Deltaproteobacteria bacterium]